MKTWERKIAPAGFFLAGLLFVVDAFLPVFRGQSFNAAFFSIGIVFAILGAATWRNAQGADSTPPQ